MIGITDLTVDAIRAGALAAISKHGLERTPANPGMADLDRLAILVEEVGEVARTLTYDQNRASLERELLDVAAVAAMWVDGLNPHTRRAEEEDAAPVDHDAPDLDAISARAGRAYPQQLRAAGAMLPAAHITPTIRATIEAAIRVARADVPALVAEVRRLRAEREAPVEVLEDAMCRRIWAAALRWEADQAREAGDRYEAQGNLRAADAAKHNASVCEIDAHRIESGALSPWADPPDPDPREDAIKVLRRHYPALPVARCGQLSVHVPHMSDVGPDHPRICPGRPAELASAPPTPATEPPAAPRPAPGTPEASSGAEGLILGRALLDRDGDVWRETWPDRWREPAHDTVRTRAELEQHLSPVCEVLLVDPSAGPTLDAAVQLRQAASLRAAESAEEALVAVAVGDTPGLDDADPELARKGSSPPAGHIGQPDPEPDGDIAPWCAMCRKAARADAPESADADLRRAGAVAMLRRIATAAEAAQAAYGRGYGADDLRQWADRIASGDLPVPGSDGEGPECGTVSGPEPAGDGPGWDRDLVVELAEGIRRATSGGETAWYEVRADDAAQLRALLADRDRLAAEHDWAFNELDTTRNERDQLQANCRAAVALADWIATHIPGEPSRSEGAAECAIRLLGQLRARVAELERSAETATAACRRPMSPPDP